jgi:hypothetical protein
MGSAGILLALAGMLPASFAVHEERPSNVAMAIEAPLLRCNLAL